MPITWERMKGWQLEGVETCESCGPGAVGFTGPKRKCFKSFFNSNKNILFWKNPSPTPTMLMCFVCLITHHNFPLHLCMPKLPRSSAKCVRTLGMRLWTTSSKSTCVEAVEMRGPSTPFNGDGRPTLNPYRYVNLPKLLGWWVYPLLQWSNGSLDPKLWKITPVFGSLCTPRGNVRISVLHILLHLSNGWWSLTRKTTGVVKYIYIRTYIFFTIIEINFLVQFQLIVPKLLVKG